MVYQNFLPNLTYGKPYDIIKPSNETTNGTQEDKNGKSKNNDRN